MLSSYCDFQVPIYTYFRQIDDKERKQQVLKFYTETDKKFHIEKTDYAMRTCTKVHNPQKIYH